MKIIDLLDKFRDESSIPTNIKVKQGIFWNCYKWDTKEQWYIAYDNEALLRITCPKDFLNEVEILEEEKKIPEKLENEQKFYSYVRYEENKDEIDKVLYILKAINLIEEKIGHLNNSINEVIDYLDYLKSKGE